ncbi:hypothetical protein Vadar_027409 [Vaccinium darrowii]|uniref:Uncharacterized protein n=1 Tax=Vaccinium darrowii TaxID=229202 RepID=A0ACB7YGL1_9ERIC|nr:hypothetical protein Vadar_027409 [Vaccinium darrowii]
MCGEGNVLASNAGICTGTVVRDSTAVVEAFNNLGKKVDSQLPSGDELGDVGFISSLLRVGTVELSSNKLSLLSDHDVVLVVEEDLLVGDVSPSVDHDVVLAVDEDIPLLVGDVFSSAGVQVVQPAPKKGRGREKGKGGGTRKLWNFNNLSGKVALAKVNLSKIQELCFRFPQDHQKMNAHRARNTILSLANDQGVWLEDPIAIEAKILGYYQRLLGTSFAQKWDPIVALSAAISHKVPHVLHEGLIAPVTDLKIWEALKSIKKVKAPGPDGFNSAFFIDN